MQTITKHIGEGFGRGELYAALAYDSTDNFGGKAVKNIRFNPATTITAITIGDSTTAITLATYAQRAITIYTTTASADSSNNAMPVYVSATMTAATGVGRAAEFVLNITNVKLGGWCNALKGKLDCKTTGSITGIASGICAELYLAGGLMATGTYAALEVEVVCPQSWSGANAKYNFMYLGASGNRVTYFDELGSLMQIVGLSAGSGSLYYNETLRIRMDTTAKYIPLSTAEGTYTTAYPIVSTYGGTAIAITSTITGLTADNVMEITTTDSQTNAANYSRSLYLSHTTSGAKTGSGEVNVLGIDLSITEHIAGYAYATSIYIAPTSGKNINHIAGISMYLENCGSGTVSRYYGIDIGKVSTNTAGDSDAFMRMYSTGTTTTGALFRVEGKSTYAFDFQANTDPIEDASVTTHAGTVYKIKCRVGSTDIYLLGSSAPS